MNYYILAENLQLAVNASLNSNLRLMCNNEIICSALVKIFDLSQIQRKKYRENHERPNVHIYKKKT